MLLIGCGPRYQGSTYQSLGADACAPWGRIEETEVRVRGQKGKAYPYLLGRVAGEKRSPTFSSQRLRKVGDTTPI